MEFRVLGPLAEVFELAGRSDEARPLLAKAIALYDQKGVTVLAKRTRARAVAAQQ